MNLPEVPNSTAACLPEAAFEKLVSDLSSQPDPVRQALIEVIYSKQVTDNPEILVPIYNKSGHLSCYIRKHTIRPSASPADSGIQEAILL